MATDQGPVVQSALLRSELIRLRKDSGLTQEQVAQDLDWSPSKLIRIEGGRSALTKVDLDALLTAYGVESGSRRERLQGLNRGARERAWWASYRDELESAYVDYVGYEAGATYIRQFQQGFVPGLLQTLDYAEVMAANSNSVDAVRAGAAVKIRMQRQVELAKRSSPPRQYHVIDEAVIRRHVGIKQDPGIMPAQLRQIADRATGEETLTVRVVPFTAGAYPGQSGPFTLLEFDGAMPDLLYLDAGRDKSLITGGDPQISQYADDFEAMLDNALTPADSIAFIRQVAEEMS
jgi:transcriptional regulator with XRE-family HTH domain